MNRRYSVFIFNVASCSDRYCEAYGREFSMEEMFDRVKSIELLSSVDIVMNSISSKTLFCWVRLIARITLKSKILST